MDSKRSLALGDTNTHDGGARAPTGVLWPVGAHSAFAGAGWRLSGVSCVNRCTGPVVHRRLDPEEATRERGIETR